MVIQLIFPRKRSDTTVATGYCAPEHVARIWWCMSSVVMASEILPAIEGLANIAACTTSKDEHSKVARTLYRSECIDGRYIRQEQWCGPAV